MLSEEALILVAVVGACALLVLGVLELVWPSKPRHPVRRPPAPPTQTRPIQPVKQPAPRARRSKTSPHARPHAAGGARVAVAGTASPRRVEGGRTTWPRGGPEAKPALDPLLVETCFSLFQERHFAEVVALGEEALAKRRAEPVVSVTPISVTRSHETAALWSVVGLAKQALGDDEGARAALESAIGAAPEAERPTYRRHLGTLALNASQTWLARGHSHDTGDRVAAIRTAVAWAERGLAAVPSDPALGDVRASAHDALWPAYEQAVLTLLQRQEFREARRLLREALDDPALPASRVDGLRELLSGTFSGEIGQLTAEAIRNMQEARESEALGSLQRAEELLATIPDEALPLKRREEVDQRLWWGYTELGSRRVEAGEYEEALDPLVHALRFGSISPDRQAETRAALVRALEGVVAVRALSIRRLADAGDRDEAVLRTEQLRELLRNCLELGVLGEELSAAFARTQRLCEELGLADPA